MDRVGYYLTFMVLLGNDNAVPLTNNNNWMRDVVQAVDIIENGTVPTVPLLWHFKEKSYYPGTILRANFFEAEQFCSFHGMRLVSILSDEENTFLGQQLYDSGFTGADDLFWTSGSRLQDDKHWVWLTSGTRIGFTNWAPGEPNHNAEKCLEVNRYKINKRKDLFWNDEQCTSKLYFICEYTKPKSIAHVLDSLSKLLNSSCAEVVPEV